MCTIVHSVSLLNSLSYTRIEMYFVLTTFIPDVATRRERSHMRRHILSCDVFRFCKFPRRSKDYIQTPGSSIISILKKLYLYNNYIKKL